MKNLLLLISCVIGINTSAQNGNYLTPYTAEDTLKAPLPGHRWKTNTTPQYVMEPLPPAADYYCIHNGHCAFSGHFDTDAAALAQCRFGSQSFTDHHDCLLKRDASTGEFSILWQVKDGVQIHTTSVVKRPKSTSSMPPMPMLPTSRKVKSAAPMPMVTPTPMRGTVTAAAAVSEGPPGVLVSKLWGWRTNAYLQDVVTGLMVSNAIGMSFDAHSNSTYRTWCQSTIGGLWKEYPMTTNAQPALSDLPIQVCLPITPSGKRFYQITQVNP